MNPALIVLFTLTFATMIGTLNETLITMVAFILLRFFSGGYHLISDVCVIVSTLLLLTLPLIHAEQYELYLNWFVLFIVLLLAPINIQAQVKLPVRYNKFLRLVSVSLVIINMIFIHSYIVALTFTAQAVSLLIEYVRRRIYDD